MFTEDILNGKLHFLGSAYYKEYGCLLFICMVSFLWFHVIF